MSRGLNAVTYLIANSGVDLEKTNNKHETHTREVNARKTFRSYRLNERYARKRLVAVGRRRVVLSLHPDRSQKRDAKGKFSKRKRKNDETMLRGCYVQVGVSDTLAAPTDRAPGYRAVVCGVVGRLRIRSRRRRR
jgi:hypothetical protein